jgi:hypothetical protein
MAMNEQDKIEIDAETTNFAHSIGVTGIGQQIALMRYCDARFNAGAKAERERVAAELRANFLPDVSPMFRSPERSAMLRYVQKLEGGNG